MTKLLCSALFNNVHANILHQMKKYLSE